MLAHADTVVCYDTVYQTLRDTILLYPQRHTASRTYAHVPDTKSTGCSEAATGTPSRTVDTTNTRPAANAQPVGRNIFEDGVDYSMLISCVY